MVKIRMINTVKITDIARIETFTAAETLASILNFLYCFIASTTVAIACIPGSGLPITGARAAWVSSLGKKVMGIFQGVLQAPVEILESLPAIEPPDPSSIEDVPSSTEDGE